METQEEDKAHCVLCDEPKDELVLPEEGRTQKEIGEIENGICRKCLDDSRRWEDF